MQRDLLGFPSDARQLIFGRALARVLAHELYHLLANTKTHARSGVAKAYYNAEELVSKTLHFGPKECESLRVKTVRLALDPLSGEGQ